VTVSLELHSRVIRAAQLYFQLPDLGMTLATDRDLALGQFEFAADLAGAPQTAELLLLLPSPDLGRAGLEPVLDVSKQRHRAES
jgi:hypothetical protein